MAKIDWDKSYGEIFGPPPVQGAKFVQNNRYFTVSGELIEDETPFVPESESVIPDDIDTYTYTELKNFAQRNNMRGTLPRSQEKLLAKIKETLG